MQLSIYCKTPYAKEISYLFAKNPNNVHERHEKGHAVRFVYHKLTDNEVEATIFVTADPLALTQNERAYDITHYINDRGFAASSIFLSLIRKMLGTALNGKPQEQYAEFAEQVFPLTFEFGPIATALSNTEITELFAPLGFQVEIETISEAQRARFIKINALTTLKQALQQIFVLIPVMDDYKHYFIDETERERIERYGEGWLKQHPQKDFIYKKALRFRHLIGSEPNVKGKVTLNTQRYETIVAHVKELPHQSVVDLGAGEGKLSALLSELPTIQELIAVEPSEAAIRKATRRFEELDTATIPQIQWGSLFYYDHTLVNKDVLILCEVIEHINEERLPKIMAMLLQQYAPKALIVTTPNADYNKVYELEEKRHDDHRFEWTRQQFESWCAEMISNTSYTTAFYGIGEQHPTYGTPTQMCIFKRTEGL
ncbi:methyltransferase domain-containing protein [Lysinibacillus louembei]|uniref:Small RNA 2'-O-methyltransferase n=1 Tax=Lysinibacillus louembei TaxID=1470088 RepID=A0ABZ0S1D1_9BACI|nr:methyltransferase domain-containing protein [Lysinibacillus louembei]WPK13406.1 methyltransferase domain-containing protein [Lysinibacillus louembei]